MGSKLDYLLEILEKNQHRHLRKSFPLIKEENFRKSDLYKEVKETYMNLGGITAEIPFKQAEWDLEFESFAIILDEEYSFNRYRAVTLKAPFYLGTHYFNLENYKRYCRQFESECLKAGRKISNWSDRESEKHFGESEEPGDLALKGSAKWKERAFFDLLTDAMAAFGKIKLIRISIYDNILINNQIIKIDNLLSSRNPLNEKYLWNYFQRRIQA